MLTRIPQITNHASIRAQERLGLDHLSFGQWVDATWMHWMPVNASFVQERGLRATAKTSFFYVNPWTSVTSIALALSHDDAIQTVMTYEQDVKIVESLEKQTIRKMLFSGDLHFQKVTQKIMGFAIQGPLSDDALQAYLDCRITFIELMQFFRTCHQRRHSALRDMLSESA